MLRLESRFLLCGAVLCISAGISPWPIFPMGVLHSEIVHTSMRQSDGYLLDGGLYSLIDYELYRPPRGIARFPDGGRPRHVYSETRLYRWDTSTETIERLATVRSRRDPGHDVRQAYFEPKEGTLSILFKTGHGSRQNPDAWSALSWDPEAGTLRSLPAEERAALLERFSYEDPARRGVSEVIAIVSSLTLERLELPSPLDYMSRRESRLVDDLVELNGDQPYRDAIVEAIAQKSLSADPGDILSRIDQQRRSLSEPYREQYALFSKETVEALKAID